MGDTFLNLTNKILTRLNEVNLNTSNFASATGVQATAKDAINNSIRKINQEEFTWPFNHTDSGDIVMVAEQSEYSLPADYKVIDWHSFFLKRDEILDPPVDARNLSWMDYYDYRNRYKAHDVNMTDPTTDNPLPSHIYGTQDDKYGIYPTPSKAYTITFEYWMFPVDLAADTDTTNIPVRFNHVIEEGAMWFMYMFRENFESAGMSRDEFRKGLSSMRTQLVNKYHYFEDTRTNDTYTRGFKDG